MHGPMNVKFKFLTKKKGGGTQILNPSSFVGYYSIINKYVNQVTKYKNSQTFPASSLSHYLTNLNPWMLVQVRNKHDSCTVSSLDSRFRGYGLYWHLRF